MPQSQHFTILSRLCNLPSDIIICALFSLISWVSLFPCGNNPCLYSAADRVGGAEKSGGGGGGGGCGGGGARVLGPASSGKLRSSFSHLFEAFWRAGVLRGLVVMTLGFTTGRAWVRIPGGVELS